MKRDSFRRQQRARQGGFSMVEMLMAAFVLAIGLLGLASLQLMSIKASRGGKSLNTAVQVAERVMDQIEMEGRLGWLNTTDSSYAKPTALTTLSFIGQEGKNPLYLTFDDQGNALMNTPQVGGTMPTTGRYVATVVGAIATAASTASTGQLSDFTVTVQFADQVDKTNQPIQRTVSITRRILHG